MLCPVCRSEQHHTGALHKQRAEIAITTLADTSKNCPITGRHLLRHQAEPGGKIASFGKGSAIGNILDCEQLLRAQEANKRMKDKAAHACQVLCRARVVEEVRLRKGTPAAEHLKLVLNVIDGLRFTERTNNERCDGGVFGIGAIIGRPRQTRVSQVPSRLRCTSK